MTENAWPDLSALYARPPTHSVTVRRNSVKDLIDCINSYQGEKEIILPKCTSPLLINEPIPIRTSYFHLRNSPPKSAEIQFGANGYFNVVGGTIGGVLDFGGFKFDGLLVNGNTVAAKAISTENTPSGGRVRWLRVLDCRFTGFDAVGAETLLLKNLELSKIADNSFGWNRTSQMHFYEESYNYGNVWIENNFIPTLSGANAGKGIIIEQNTSGKRGGTIISHANQYYGGTVSSPSSLAIQAKTTNDFLAGIVSNMDRFEGCKVFAADIGASYVSDVKILNSPQILFNAAYDAELIEFVEACHRCLVQGCSFERGGVNNITGIRDENTSTGDNVNQALNNMFKYWEDAENGSTHLTKAVGSTIVEENSVYTP